MALDEKKTTSFLAILFVVLLVGFLWIPIPAFSGSLPGHLLGIFGTTVMMYTLVYPYRKRLRGKKGKQNPIRNHIYAGIIGPSLVVLHSGHAYSSWIGTLAFLSMITIVLSGLSGRFLLRRINRTVKEQKKDLNEMKGTLTRRKKQIDPQACSLYLGLPAFEPESNAALDPITEGRCDEMVVLARTIVETEYALRGFSQTKTLFDKWRRLHIYLTLFLFAMVIVHVLSTTYYGLRWLP